MSKYVIFRTIKQEHILHIVYLYLQGIRFERIYSSQLLRYVNDDSLTTIFIPLTALLTGFYEIVKQIIHKLFDRIILKRSQMPGDI